MKLELPEHTIRYELEGPKDAPVIMFSNSLGSDLSMWQPQTEALRGRFRILRYDTRGHGQSAVPAGDYTFQQLIGDVIALLDALSIDKVHFCGLSLGGMTALGMAIHHPERLRSITSANCVASYPEEGKKVWAERIGQVRENGLASLLDGTIQRWFTADFIAANTTLVEQVKAMILATPESGYIGCCGALSQLAYQEGLASINVPTLFVAGTHDQGAPAAAMRAMHEAVTGSGYVELDAAHVSNLECPSEFTEALLSVIER